MMKLTDPSPRDEMSLKIIKYLNARRNHFIMKQQNLRLPVFSDAGLDLQYDVGLQDAQDLLGQGVLGLAVFPLLAP